jgi:hypothetical protein
MSGDADASQDLPTTYAPDEIQTWLAAGAAGAQVRRMDAFRNSTGRLENLEIHLDVDTETTQVRPSERFMKGLEALAGSQRFERHFELPAAAELVAHAMAKGRFHSIMHVEADGETLFDHAERGKSVRETVDLLTEAGHRRTRCDTVVLRAVDDDFGDTTCVATLRREPKRKAHQLHLRFEGDVPEEDFQAILTTLRKDLNVFFPVNQPAA